MLQQQNTTEWLTAPEAAKRASCKTKDIQRAATEGIIEWKQTTDGKKLYAARDLANLNPPPIVPGPQSKRRKQ